MSEPAMTPIKAAADPILLPCPFCKKPPGSKVGPPAMVRCITPGCEGTKLAAYTLAEWNTRAAPAGNDGVRKQAYEIARHVIGHLEGNCGLSFSDVKQDDWDTLTNLIAARGVRAMSEPFVKDQAHRERIEKGEAVLPSYPDREALRQISEMPITPDTGASTAMAMRRLAAEAVGTPIVAEDDIKLVYVKRWRTLVKLPAKYADEIVEALRGDAQTCEPIAWMNSEHIDAYRAGKRDGIAWAAPDKSDFYNVALCIAPQSTGVAQGSEVTPAMINAGAQALANDVWHPPQQLMSLALYEQDKFRRQARIVLEAASPVPSTLRQCPICVRRVASPCETLAIATSCPLSSTESK